MKATIQELEIRPNFKIRKGSVVALDFWNDGKPIEAKVDEIFMDNDKVFIESMTVSYGSLMTHSANQYRESGTLIKY